MAVNSNQALIDKLVNLNGGCDIELDKSKITENLIQKKYETQLNSFIYPDERQAYLTQTRQFYSQGAGSDAINDYINQFKQNYANYRQGIAKIKTSAVNITASNAIPAVITTGAATSVSNPAYTAIDNLQKLTALQSSLSVVINVVISMLSAAAALYLTLPKSLTDEINDLQDIKKDVDDAIDDANKNKDDNPWDPNDHNNGENSNWKQIVELIDGEIDEAIRKALEIQNQALEDMRKAIEAGRTKGQVISYSEYLAMQGQYDNNTVYVVKTDDGTTVLGQIIRGIYMPIPLSANAESVITLTQEEYDALESPNPYTLYVIVDENGTIVRMYLGGKELNQEGIIRSVITSMFSEKITLNEDNTKITSINWTMLNVDDPGQFYAQTGLENLVTNQILSSGFASKADVDGAFAEVYAQIQDINTGKVNKAYVITEINASGESGVKIHADKIQITGNNSITAAVEFYDWLTGEVGDGKAGLDLKADREKAIADLASQTKTDIQTATANMVLYTSYDESSGVLTVQYKKDDATALASLYTSSTVDGALAGIRTDFNKSLTTAMAEVYTKSQVDNAIAGLRTEFNDGITAATSGLLSTKEGNLLYATKETTKINRFFGTGTGNGWTLSQPKTTATKAFAADTRLFTIDNYYPIGMTHLSSDAYTTEYYNANLVSPAVEVDTEKYYVVSFNVKKDDRVDFWIQFAYATASTADMTVNDSQTVAFSSALADGVTVVAGKAIRIKKYDNGDYYRYFIVFKPTQKYMRVYFVNQLHQDDITSTSTVTKDATDTTLAWPYGSDTSDHTTTEYSGSSDGKTLTTTTTLHRYTGSPSQTYVKVTVKTDTAVSGKLYLMKLQLEEAANQTLTDIVPGEYKEDQVTIESYIQQTAEAITIKAQDIHLEGYTTINGGFSIDEQGNMTANNATINGTINATSGHIGGTILYNPNTGKYETTGGFNISGSGLSYIVTGEMSKQDDMAYIICRNDTYGRFAGIGANVLPASTGTSAVARFENNDTTSFQTENIAMILQAQGKSGWDYGITTKNIACATYGGCFTGFALGVKIIDASTSAQTVYLKRSDNVITCIGGNQIDLYLLDAHTYDDGHVFIIKKDGNCDVRIHPYYSYDQNGIKQTTYLRYDEGAIIYGITDYLTVKSWMDSMMLIYHAGLQVTNNDNKTTYVGGWIQYKLPRAW